MDEHEGNDRAFLAACSPGAVRAMAAAPGQAYHYHCCSGGNGRNPTEEKELAIMTTTTHAGGAGANGGGGGGSKGLPLMENLDDGSGDKVNACFGGFMFGDDDVAADHVDGFFEDLVAAGMDVDMVIPGAASGAGAEEEDLNWLDDLDSSSWPLALLPGSGGGSGGGGDLLPEGSVSPPPAESGGVVVPVEAAVPTAAVEVSPVSNVGSAPGHGGYYDLSGVAAAATPIPEAVSDGTSNSAVGYAQNQAAVGIDEARVMAMDAAPGSATGSGYSGGGIGGSKVSPKEERRLQAVARFKAKRARRRWSRPSTYESRQRVANARPRSQGRFLPQPSKFMSVADLQRQQRAEMKKILEAKAAARAAQQQQQLGGGGF